MRWLAYIPALFTFCSIAFYLLSLWSTTTYFAQRRMPLGKLFTPPVSILKPVRGAQPETYENFRSHCLQYYPEYEVIFGVKSIDDPAVALIRRLRGEFPALNIRHVVCGEELGANPKVSKLIQMLPASRYKYLLVNDDDIAIPADCLRRVMSNFIYSRIGMVTTLYRGIAGPTVGSKLEALGIATDFSAGVLAARQIERGLHFALGSTMAISRDALDQIGGFEPIADCLADDYELGRRVARTGLDVVLSDVVVETHLPPYTLGGYVHHQMRWGRTLRDARKHGYLGVGLTFGIPWAMLTVLAAHGRMWSWGLLAAVLLLRFLVAWVVGVEAVQDRQVLKNLWLLPLRDWTALGIWVTSLVGHKIQWRGETFVLKDGKLYRGDA